MPKKYDKNPAKQAPKLKPEEVIAQFSASVEHERVSVNSISLNTLFGGAMTLGKFYLCSSPEGVGKSTMALWISRAFCEQGRKVLYVDAEGALNMELIEGIGLKQWADPDDPGALFKVLVLDTMSKLDELFGAITSGTKKMYDLVIIDSWNHVQPALRKDIPIEDVRPGVKATQDGIFLPKYKTECLRLETAVWIIAQKRTSFAAWQASYETAVSNALKFCADCTLELTKKDFFNDDLGNVTGSVCEIEATKNKVGGPAFRKKPLHIVFRKGVDDLRALTSLMIQGKDYKGDLGPTVVQKGAYYYPRVADNPPTEENPNGNGMLGYAGLNKWVSENIEVVTEELQLRDLI